MISFFILIDYNCSSSSEKDINIHWNQIKYKLLDKIKNGTKINLYVYLINFQQIDVIIENANINHIDFSNLCDKIKSLIYDYNSNYKYKPISTKQSLENKSNNKISNFKQSNYLHKDSPISTELYSILLTYLFFDIIKTRDNEQNPIKPVEKVNLNHFSSKYPEISTGHSTNEDLISLYSYYQNSSTCNDDLTIYDMNLESSSDEDENENPETIIYKSSNNPNNRRAPNRLEFCQSPIRSGNIQQSKFNRLEQIICINYLYPKNTENKIILHSNSNLPNINENIKSGNVLSNPSSPKRKRNMNYFFFINQNTNFENFNKINGIFNRLKPLNAKLSQYILVNFNMNDQLVLKNPYNTQTINEDSQVNFENNFFCIDKELEEKMNEFINKIENENNINKNYLKKMNKNIGKTADFSSKFHSDFDKYINDLNENSPKDKSKIIFNLKSVQLSKKNKIINHKSNKSFINTNSRTNEFPNLKYSKLISKYPSN